MTREDFTAFAIQYFTPKEITNTGAKLSSVSARLVQHLDRFRGIIGRPVNILVNGLTTGKHSAIQHPDGIAADVSFGDIDPVAALKAALKCDFKGIGFYWVEGRGWVSMHLDLRSEYSLWRGYRSKKMRSWKYYSLIDGF